MSRKNGEAKRILSPEDREERHDARFKALRLGTWAALWSGVAIYAGKSLLMIVTGAMTPGAEVRLNPVNIGVAVLEMAATAFVAVGGFINFSGAVEQVARAETITSGADCALDQNGIYVYSVVFDESYPAEALAES